MIEIKQNRKQGTILEKLIKERKLTQQAIARKIGKSERTVNKVIWGESNDSVIQESLAILLGFRSWKHLSKVCS